MYRLSKFNYFSYLLHMLIIGVGISFAIYTYFYVRYVSFGMEADVNSFGATVSSNAFFGQAFFIWMEQFNIVWMIAQGAFVIIYNILAIKTGGFIVEVESITDISKITIPAKSSKKVIDKYIESVEAVEVETIDDEKESKQEQNKE